MGREDQCASRDARNDMIWVPLMRIPAPETPFRRSQLAIYRRDYTFDMHSCLGIPHSALRPKSSSRSCNHVLLAGRGPRMSSVKCTKIHTPPGAHYHIPFLRSTINHRRERLISGALRSCLRLYVFDRRKKSRTAFRDVTSSSRSKCSPRSRPPHPAICP